MILEYSIDVRVIETADCVILPGSKNTCADLEFLYDKGIAGILKKKAGQNQMVVGICGGYQMLDRKIVGLLGIEGGNNIKGLVLLNIETEFGRKKILFRLKPKI